MPKNIYMSEESLRHYHNYVANQFKKLSDDIDERVSEKFNQIIGKYTQDGEVLDARIGERTLGNKIRKIDSNIKIEKERIDLLREQTTYLLDQNTTNSAQIDNINETFYIIQGEQDSVIDGLYDTFASKQFDFNSSLDSNGYQKLPNGLTIQWGNTPFENGTFFDKRIDFPLTFEHSCFSVNVCLRGDTPNHYVLSGWGVCASHTDTRGFTCYARNIAGDNLPDLNVSVGWIAIGC